MRYRCCNLIHNLITGFPPDPNPPDPPELLPLILTFNDINNTGVVGDPTDVNEWNSAIVTSGTPYTSVVINGNSAELYGGSNVTLYSTFAFSTELQVIDDQALSITSLVDGAFQGCTVLYYVILNALTAVPDNAFNSVATVAGGTVEVNSATTIGYRSFIQWLSLNSVSATSCETCGQEAFFGCTGLTTANLLVCTEVGEFCFSGCGQGPGSFTITIPLLEIAGAGAFDTSKIITFSENAMNLHTAGSGCFNNCNLLTALSLPVLVGSIENNFVASCNALVTFSAPLIVGMGIPPGVGTESMSDCFSLQTIYIPLCAQLGGSVGDDLTFQNITGNTITITVPVALQTCDAGNPDGDLVYLAANNTATIIYV